MQVIEIKTLIDITNTNVRRINQGTQQELDQFRNWTTLMQCIGMRAIVDYDRDPVVETVDIKGMGFGEEYKGKHQVWTFHFRPDQSDSFSNKGDPVGLLKSDLDNIPVIVNLTESINTKQAVFSVVNSKFANTVVKAL